MTDDGEVCGVWVNEKRFRCMSHAENPCIVLPKLGSEIESQLQVEIEISVGIFVWIVVAHLRI